MVRKQATEPAPAAAAAPPVAAAPSEAASPSSPARPGPGPQVPRETRVRPHQRAARIEPLTLTKDGTVMPSPKTAPAQSSKTASVDKSPPATRPKPSSGGSLPHKTVATDSKSVAPPSTAGVATSPEDTPTESAPLTEAEMKQQAEASIDADGVRFVVKAHLAQVHACWERAFKDGSSHGGGQVEIGFAVATDGKPVRVRVESNSTASDLLAKCLESRVREWQFPRPVGGEVDLIYPFVFSKGS
jgi:hypothetical protein